MNEQIRQFKQIIRGHLDELESARSQLGDNASTSTDHALDAVRRAFATIEDFLQKSTA